MTIDFRERKKDYIYILTFHDSCYFLSRLLDMSVLLKINFLFLNQNICCGFSKQLSQ